MAIAPPLISARGLCKRFRTFLAVDHVDFDVYRGEAFGFLGPNGAGKTSTMRMIGCVSPISDGQLTVLGMNPNKDGAAIRARLGVVPQTDNLDQDLPVRENLEIYGRYFGMSRQRCTSKALELLDFVQLRDRELERIDSLSGGMKRRLVIARALINDPEILLLDEPTTGLDPQARHLVWERLYQLKRQGTTLLLTTHYMDEAEQLCDRLLVMDNGKIVASGTPRELVKRYCAPEVVELRFDEPGDGDAVTALNIEGVERTEVLPDRILLYTDAGESALSALHAQGIAPTSSLIRRSTLEDVFLRLTGRSLVE